MKRLFGELDSGEKIYAYKIANESIQAEIMNYGATVLWMRAFGVDVVSGFDSFEPYIKNPENLGVTVGRVANRIKDGILKIDGKEYVLPQNNLGNCLHGGSGFAHKVWSVKAVSEHSITLSYTSPDGEDGFPAKLVSDVTYTVDRTALKIKYAAIPDGKTSVALTNHAYFNLDGFGGDIKEHTLRIWANNYTEVDKTLIPTGNHPAVEGTRFDLRQARRIGDGLADGDYDHNFILAPEYYAEFDGQRLALAAEYENRSLKLSVYTDQPGIQVYSGNGLGDGEPFRGGVKQVKYGAICLETQIEPNAVNHGIGVYSAGEKYTHTCVYKIDRKDS